MKIFITGATGFIGGQIARKLRERGDEVVALARSPEKARGLGEGESALKRSDRLCRVTPCLEGQRLDDQGFDQEPRPSASFGHLAQ